MQTASGLQLLTIPYRFSLNQFEEGWDTDPEEEAFVDELAAKLMDDTMEDLDDEDPDMDDWGDLYSDGEDNENTMEADDEALSDGGDQGHSDDIDAFMEEESDTEQSKESQESEGGLDEESDGTENDLALIAGSDDDETEEEPKASKTGVAEETFADASEYEDMITRAWIERKRTASVDELSYDGDEVGKASFTKGKKRKRKRKKKQ